ncbi:hypothetical protein FA15DRAFT_708921 [Coprinopsis marcescibilis]|uniref:Uncharacterized protein n=1 Tax=Coprinopsis marcescibilis TaxID=230819 RepID=A0A5C3KGZ6_COPMA|nr:hypothetical protein FA15DRAFT_708921 [Coprinopsis marcescibilis]
MPQEEFSLPSDALISDIQCLGNGDQLEDGVSENGAPYQVGVRVFSTPEGLDMSFGTPAPSKLSLPSLSPSPPQSKVQPAPEATGAGDVHIQAHPVVHRLDIDWPVTVTGSQERRWTATGPKAYAIGVESYILTHNPKALVYKYALDIYISQVGWFTFKDEEGDTYKLNVTGWSLTQRSRGSIRYICFNSKKATIKHVTWTPQYIIQ